MLGFSSAQKTKIDVAPGKMKLDTLGKGDIIRHKTRPVAWIVMSDPIWPKYRWNPTVLMMNHKGVIYEYSGLKMYWGFAGCQR